MLIFDFNWFNTQNTGFDEKEIDGDSTKKENEEEDYNEEKSNFNGIALIHNVKKIKATITLPIWKKSMFLNKTLVLTQILFLFWYSLAYKLVIQIRKLKICDGHMSTIVKIINFPFKNKNKIVLALFNLFPKTNF